MGQDNEDNTLKAFYGKNGIKRIKFKLKKIG